MSLRTCFSMTAESASDDAPKSYVNRRSSDEQ
jgi:hypothetical protein